MLPTKMTNAAAAPEIMKIKFGLSSPCGSTTAASLDEILDAGKKEDAAANSLVNSSFAVSELVIDSSICEDASAALSQPIRALNNCLFIKPSVPVYKYSLVRWVKERRLILVQCVVRMNANIILVYLQTLL